jgi:hypothetical protein
LAAQSTRRGVAHDDVHPNPGGDEVKAHRKAIITVILTSLALSGCAYKPLKAPCSPDEGGQPLAYAPPASTPEPFRSLDSCGPMKPI